MYRHIVVDNEQNREAMENAPDNAGSSPARFFTNQEQSQKERVQTFIDNILIEILDELRTPDGRPTLTLKRRSRGVPRSINPENLALESEEKEILSSYSWPGTNAYEAWKFTAIIRGLSVIAEAIQAGLVVSKRDIYYSDPACFGSQQIVDTIIDDIAHTIGVDRAALNVVIHLDQLFDSNVQLTSDGAGSGSQRACCGILSSDDQNWRNGGCPPINQGRPDTENGRH